MLMAFTSEVGASLLPVLVAEARAQAQTAPVEAIDASVAAQISGKALYLVSGMLEYLIQCPPQKSYAETWGLGPIATCL
jgi:hypothetical protein